PTARPVSLRVARHSISLWRTNRMRRIRSVLLTLLSALAVSGCVSQGQPAARPSSESTGAGTPARGDKTIVLSQINTTKQYGPWDFSNTSGGGSALLELHTVGLVTTGRSGDLETRIAAKVPSLTDGS